MLAARPLPAGSLVLADQPAMLGPYHAPGPAPCTACYAPSGQYETELCDMCGLPLCGDCRATPPPAHNIECQELN